MMWSQALVDDDDVYSTRRVVVEVVAETVNVEPLDSKFENATVRSRAAIITDAALALPESPSTRPATRAPSVASTRTRSSVAFTAAVVTPVRTSNATDKARALPLRVAELSNVQVRMGLNHTFGGLSHT